MLVLWAAIMASPVSYAYSDSCTQEDTEMLRLPEGILARVTVDPEPTVAGAEIILSDIACIEGDPDLVDRLSGLSVGTAPLIGGTREFATATLNLRMRQGGIDDRTVEVQGPAVFTVSRKSSVLSAATLEAQVRQAIVEKLPPGSELTLTFQSVSDMPVPDGEFEVRVSRLPARLAGPISIGVDIVVDGKAWKSTTVRAEASLMQPAWVATVPILRGEPLGEHNTELRVVEGNGTMQPAQLDYGTPLRANRTIQPDSVIELRFVEVIPDAKNGQSVVVTLAKPGMHVQALGTLLADAMIGDMVNVRNVDSGRTLSGRLVSAERVVVELP